MVCGISIAKNILYVEKRSVNMDKVVLAYSGGLDTTAVIPWLKETYGYEVI